MLIVSGRLFEALDKSAPETIRSQVVDKSVDGLNIVSGGVSQVGCGSVKTVP